MLTPLLLLVLLVPQRKLKHGCKHRLVLKRRMHCICVWPTQLARTYRLCCIEKLMVAATFLARFEGEPDMLGGGAVRWAAAAPVAWLCNLRSAWTFRRCISAVLI